MGVPGGPNQEPLLTPGQAGTLRLAAWFLAVMVLVRLSFGLYGLQIYLAGWFGYGCFLAARWAIREDRKDISGVFERDFLDELKSIERLVAGTLKPKREPKEEDVLRNDEGEIMLCIICGEYANREGFFCNTHDEGKYKRGQP